MIRDELDLRVRSLEAERLRPVPAKPPKLPSGIDDAFTEVLDRLTVADAEDAIDHQEHQ